jgi:TonB family protein
MSKTDAWKAWEGRVVDGKYTLRQWVGGSDHSAVFLTDRSGRPSEKAAIKLIDWSGDADAEVARIRSAAKLSHPHLISIYEGGRGVVDGTPLIYVVMEYADEDLSQILPQRALTPAEVSDMLPPVLEGLSYLHSNGFVHSRIKPSNVLAAGEQLKLSADQVMPAGGPAPKRRGVAVYDAPELSGGTISPAADVWSLGVTIITALTQQATATPGAQTDPGVPGNLPEPFRSIVRECLYIDPQRRCSLDDMRAQLQSGRRNVPVSAEPTSVAERDSNRLPVFVIPLVLVVLALAAWGLFHSRGKDSSSQKAETAPQQSVQSAPQHAPEPKPSPADASTALAPKKTKVGGGAVVHQVMPDVPQSAKNTISGTIKISVQVQVDAAGKVTSAKLKSAGPSRYFAGRVLKAAEQWQFSPPQANGVPTTSAWLITFRLRRNGIQASPERITR